MAVRSGTDQRDRVSLSVAVDAHDWKLFRSIFTDEVEILLSVAARADRPHQVVNADKFTRATSKIMTASFQITQHFLSDYHIEVDGNDATCLCYVQARHIPPKDKPGQEIWDIGGYYTFQLKRTGDGWKIRKYTGIITWEINRPRDLTIDL
jgi:SnoaL-like domain